MSSSFIIRQDWTETEIAEHFEQPLLELLLKAQSCHRQFFKTNTLQLSTLLSIKTGSCPEDCAYCPQSAHYQTGLEKEKMLSLNKVKEAAITAKANGATRFCMGGAWRSPPKSEFNLLLEMIKIVKALNLETCLTVGMLSREEAEALANQGLDFYNHNLDTSPAYYKKIITTRTYENRLNTLENVRTAGIKVCCGGIIGMGEARKDRIQFLQALSNLSKHPESVTINCLIPIPGTPLSNTPKIDPFEVVRVIAIARILMPRSMIRLSAGRESMSEELQTLCLLAGANSFFYGDQLLTANNQAMNKDQDFFSKLGIQLIENGESIVCNP